MNQQTESQPGLTTQNAYDVKDLNLWYGDQQALIDVSLDIQKNKVTSLPGWLSVLPVLSVL